LGSRTGPRGGVLLLVILGSPVVVLGLIILLRIAGIAIPSWLVWLVAGVAQIGLLLLGIRLAFKPWNQRVEEQRRILATGAAGEAVVQSFKATGMWIKFAAHTRQLEMELDLVIAVGGHRPYRVSHRTYIPEELVSLLTRERPLPVKVDSADPSKIAIDWCAARQLRRPDTTGPQTEVTWLPRGKWSLHRR
jgi:hypothetical protein